TGDTTIRCKSHETSSSPTRRPTSGHEVRTSAEARNGRLFVRAATKSKYGFSHCTGCPLTSVKAIGSKYRFKSSAETSPGLSKYCGSSALSPARYVRPIEGDVFDQTKQ